MSKNDRPHLVLKARNISLSYGAHKVLDSIDIELYAGEVTALLGPNGAGKSSLLKCLSGEITSDCHLEYFEQAQWQAKKLARHVAVLPQQSTLSFPFLVEEVVALGALPLSFGKKAIRSKAVRPNATGTKASGSENYLNQKHLSQKDINQICQQYMDMCDVAHLSDRLYPSLSGGEKQRVHLARVLTQLHHSGDQKILMLDEPTSALDLAHQHNTLSMAKNLAKQQNAAVIVVLHDLNLAAQYADRLVLLSQGKIVKDASPWHALTAETIEQVYGYCALIDSHPTMDFPVVYPKR